MYLRSILTLCYFLTDVLVLVLPWLSTAFSVLLVALYTCVHHGSRAQHSDFGRFVVDQKYVLRF